MRDHAADQISELVRHIFTRRWTDGRAEWMSERNRLVAEYSGRRMLKSGVFASAVRHAASQALLRATDSTLRELSLAFREADRRDGEFFWDVVGDQLLGLLTTVHEGSFLDGVEECIRQHGAARGKGDVAPDTHWGDPRSWMLEQVKEQRLRSQFIAMKSPADRRAHGIPDVAVMMWFPDRESDGAEHVQRADEIYASVRAAAHEASGGMAVTRAFSDPDLTPQRRISEAVEQWLGKAVLVVCDLFGDRKNVYYEAGYTRAIGTDLILTCPQCTWRETGFHLQQVLAVQYRTADDLQEQLEPRMRTVLDRYDLQGSPGV